MKHNLSARLHSYNTKDPVSGLRVEDVTAPDPGPNQVLVRMTLRPINPSDVFCLQGIYPGFKPEKLPAVPGAEGVGTVDTNGEGAKKFSVGQRVVGASWASATGNGTWQQYVLIDEDKLRAVPDNVTEVAAAQSAVNPVTAIGFFDVLKIPQGDWLLQIMARPAASAKLQW